MVRLQQDIADYREELKQCTDNRGSSGPDARGACSVNVVTATCDWDAGGACSGDAGGACSGKVTATYDRHTESPTTGCEPSSADGIRTVDASISRGTAPVPATATTMQWTSGYSDWGRRLRAVRHRIRTVDMLVHRGTVEKLLQRLMTDTQSRPLPVVNPPAPTKLEQSMRPFLAEQHRRRRPPQRRQPARRDWSNVWQVGSCSNTMP